MIPREVFAQTLLQFFAPVRRLLDDPAVTEVVINGPGEVYAERGGRLQRTDCQFASQEALLAALRNAAQFVGRRVDESEPILQGRLPDGSRLQAVLPPVAPEGPFVAIRRFSGHTLTLGRLVESDALSRAAARFIEGCVVARLNVLVAGGAGSGKTSLLGALAGCVPPDERIVVIEDCRELRTPRGHVVGLEARAPDPGGGNAVGIGDLFRAALRLRPDRIFIGEIRGGEALDIVQAMTSGHGGCMATLHATLPRDTLARLETMCLMSGTGLPLGAIREQIGSGVDLLIQLSRQRDGSRKVTHVTEVAGFDSTTGKYELNDLFVREYRQSAGAEPTASALVYTGRAVACQKQLHQHGVNVAPEGAPSAEGHGEGARE